MTANVHIVRENSLLSAHENENYFDSYADILSGGSPKTTPAVPLKLNIFSSTSLLADAGLGSSDNDYADMETLEEKSTGHRRALRSASVALALPGTPQPASAARLETHTDEALGAPEVFDHAVLKDTALRLHRQEFQSIRVEEYTQYLASPLAENAIIRDYYMDFFLWKKSLLGSLRTLCSKLYFKGESQEIDRILRSFAKSWLKQYPRNSLGDGVEEIHVASYSLILLNTGLHNSHSTKRMSKDEFTRNTIQTLVGLAAETPGARRFDVARRLGLERELIGYYEGLSHEALPLHAGAVRSRSSGRSARNSVVLLATRAEDLRALHSNPRPAPGGGRRSRGGSASASLFSVEDSFSYFNESIIEEADENIDEFDEGNLVGFARALKGEAHPAQAPTSASTASRRTPHVVPRTSTGTLNRPVPAKGLATADNFDSNFHIIQDDFDTHLDLQGAPYMKEGLLRHRLSDVTRSSQRGFFGLLRLQRDKWEENLVSVLMGVLRIYSFNKTLVKKRDASAAPPKSRSTFGHRSAAGSRRSFMLARSVDTTQTFAPPSEVVGDGNWLKSAVKLAEYPLCSGYAVVVRNLPVKGNECYWTLQIPRASALPSRPKEHQTSALAVALMADHVTTITFCAGTKEVAQEYIDTCNFWASRVSAIPIDQPITSLEYGWGPSLTASLAIARWAYAPGGVYLSHLQIFPQLSALIGFYHELEARVQAHAGLKAGVMGKTLKATLGSKTHRLVMENWQDYMTILQFDLVRYKTYLQILMVGVKSRLLLMSATLDLSQIHTGIDALDDDYVEPFDTAKLRESIAEMEAHFGGMKKSKGSVSLRQALA